MSKDCLITLFKTRGQGNPGTGTTSMGMATYSYLVSYKAACFPLKTKYGEKKEALWQQLATENGNAPEMKVKVLSSDSLWKEICSHH